jgi:hypothetical protein
MEKLSDFALDVDVVLWYIHRAPLLRGSGDLENDTEKRSEERQLRL